MTLLASQYAKGQGASQTHQVLFCDAPSSSKAKCMIPTESGVIDQSSGLSVG